MLEYVNRKLVPKDKNIKGLDKIEGKFFLQLPFTTVFLYEGHTFLTPILAKKAGQVLSNAVKYALRYQTFSSAFLFANLLFLASDSLVFENRLLIVNERWSLESLT
jgi:hypothetical protein